MSWFSEVTAGPPDVIFGIAEAFRKDPKSEKLNVGMGVYRTEELEPYVLLSIRRAEEEVMKKALDKEYSSIVGIPEFCKAAVELAVGKNNPAVIAGHNATVQTISGTGALRVAGNFLEKWFPGNKCIYLSDPSWPNHKPIFNAAGLKLGSYRYYNHVTGGFNLKAAVEDINKIPENSIILFHACAHNPTGADPSLEEWAELSKVVKAKKLLPFFDMCYQGFASGDVDIDAAGMRLFLKDGHQLVLAQSFAKNMGLYGERVGALTFFCGTKHEAENVMSQLKILIRPMYSNPPIHGARIALEVLTNPELKAQWLKELKSMTDRIRKMRALLKHHLELEGSTINWSHIVNQTGMMAYTGMTYEQVQRITKDFSVYLTSDGRIAMVRLNSKNVPYLARAMHAVTK